MKRVALGLIAFVVLYLALAAVWAWTMFGQAMASAVYAAPLAPRHAAILLKVEDPAFYSHRGLSVAPGQGFATITSALARDLYLSRQRFDGAGGALQSMYAAVFKCCKRIDLGRDVMALVLDARLSKDAQLRLFSATVYMGTHEGQQLRGLGQAARSYLGKELGALSDAEFIGLVAMIKAPNTFHPVRQPVAHAGRAARVAALVAGRCEAGGWFDTALTDCDR